MEDKQLDEIKEILKKEEESDGIPWLLVLLSLIFLNSCDFENGANGSTKTKEDDSKIMRDDNEKTE